MTVSNASAVLSARLLRDWSRIAAAGMQDARGEINDLNVFPIPDSDTGTNMAYTMSAAARAAELAGDHDTHNDPRVVARAMAEAAVSSARGNSGVILSQVFVGLADAVDRIDDGIDNATDRRAFGRLVAQALEFSARAARRAVSVPREGTVLTLLSSAAQTAVENIDARPADLVRAIADQCAEDLDATTEQMPELAAAGVVDAGGRGMLVVIDSLVAALTGVVVRRRHYRGALDGGGGLTGHGDTHDPGNMDYEVMYVIEGDAAAKIPGLRAALDDLGDSVVIVGDSSGDAGERFSVHVHTCAPGAAIEAGLALGRVHDICISCFALDAARASALPSLPPPARRRAVVAVAKGEQAAELFAGEGADVVRADSGMTAESLVAAVSALDAGHVIVMVNGALRAEDRLRASAQLRAESRTVVFLPTMSMAQCLAALAVHDADAAPDADAYAMAQASASTRWGSLVAATAEAYTMAGRCEPGDYLGIVNADVFVIHDEALVAAAALVDLMLTTGGELVTLLVGESMSDELAQRLARHVHDSAPGVECVVYRTGQTDELVQIGVE